MVKGEKFTEQAVTLTFNEDKSGKITINSNSSSVVNDSTWNANYTKHLLAVELSTRSNLLSGTPKFKFNSNFKKLNLDDISADI